LIGRPGPTILERLDDLSAPSAVGYRSMSARPDDVTLADVQRLRKWLAEARAGSADALGRLLEFFRFYLTRVARSEIADGLQAKCGASDVVQDTFLEAQRDFPRFDGGCEEDLKAWLRQILVNNLKNVHRHYAGTDKRRVDREAPLEAAGAATGPGPATLAVQREQQDALDAALARLPDQYLRVVLLRNREHLSFEEIGATIGRTAEAARKLWARAIEQLQTELNPPAHDA
jgi:RNA polymerase sigma-70 factor (ECF subfamily)